MDQLEALVGASQLGVALSGFAGVVFALSGHEATALPENRQRLRVLLQNGLAACFLSLVPQLLWGLVPLERVWALSSGVLLLYCSVATARSLRQASRDRASDRAVPQRVSAPFVVSATVGAVLVVGLQVANILLWQNFNAFFLGVVFVLLTAALMFIRLLTSKLAA